MSWFFRYGLLYLSIFSSAIVLFTPARRRLEVLGYEKQIVTWFLVCISISAIPSIHIAPRLFRMFYYPSAFWHYRFWLDQFQIATQPSFQISIVIALFLFTFITLSMRFKLIETLDTIALYIPAGTVIGMTTFILLGGILGEQTGTFHLHTSRTLWFCIGNIMIFLLLRGAYNTFYIQNYSSYGGLLLALYLILHGNLIIVLEEKGLADIVIWGLTQTQTWMFLQVALGIYIFLIIMIKKTITKLIEDDAQEKFYMALLGFSVVFFPFTVLLYGSFLSGVIQWPIRYYPSLSDAIDPLFVYLPFIIFSLSTLIWLKIAKLPIVQLFRWRNNSISFLVGLAISGGFTIYLLNRIHSISADNRMWLFVILFSLLNSICEEMIFRGVLFRILKKIIPRRTLANAVQSSFYALLHFHPAGPLLALGSWFYGMLLGHILEKTKSIVPGIICHFVIDIGLFGLAVFSKENLF